MDNNFSNSSEFSRRDILKLGAISAAGMLFSRAGFAAEEPVAAAPKTIVWVFHGKNKKNLMAACLKTIADNGGFGKSVKKLALKVNAAWMRAPERGANTHPELVDHFLAGCRQAGISEVAIPENGCDRVDGPGGAFAISGILAAVTKNGFKMVGGNALTYVKTAILKAKALKEAEVIKEFLESDVIVNMPVAKHHSGAQFSCAMKNWMGIVKDRGIWHKNGIHQCIADFATLITPTWTIVDATRVMLTGGPKGSPTSKMKTPAPDEIILSKNQVSADAVASTHLVDSPNKLSYLRIAKEMGLGDFELANLDIKRMEVA